jgi:hypothetical protein
LWRCGDGLFFEVPPLLSDELLTTLHPLLKRVLKTVDYFEISCLGAPFSWLEKPRNLKGRDLDCMMGVLMKFHRPTFSKSNREFNSDSQNSDRIALSVRELYHSQFSLQMASPETFGYTLVGL